MPLIILADDLTGAADCAARCSHAGLPAAIYLQPPAQVEDDGATALSSDSRHLLPGAAAQQVRSIIGRLAPRSDALWYKKIDSTLRGNIGSEIAAMLSALQAPQAIICPAFPAQGRGLRDGSLVYAQSDRSAHLPTLLEQQAGCNVAAIALSDVRAGVDRLAGRLAEATARLIVVDALSDQDLELIVRAASRALPAALFCGSAGLIGALAGRHPGLHRAAARASEAADAFAPAGPTLFVVGSGSEMAHRQIDFLRRHVPVTAIEVGPELAQVPDGDVLLHLPPPAAQSNLDSAAARAYAAALAATAEQVSRKLQPALVVLVGGDTALHVLDRLNICRLSVVRELLPGMPLTVGVDGTGRRYGIVLKAGNHGDASTLALIQREACSNRW